MVRLQKFLAEAGVASRRGGEEIILAGRVAVLEKGRIAACGRLADIRAAPPTPFARRLFSPPASVGVAPISDQVMPAD